MESPGPRSVINMRNLERMPLNILLQIRDLFEAEIEAQRRLIASTIPVTETQRQELEQRGELSIESINNRSTEIRRQLMIDITRIIMTELISMNFDAEDEDGSIISLDEVVQNGMMGYSDSDDAAQDASTLLNEEEWRQIQEPDSDENEPELNVDENVDEITNLFAQINQNDAEIARLRNEINEQSYEAFDSENRSAEGGAPKIESPEEEQQFVENLSNLDILQTTQNTDSSGNIITKREPTFLGNENLVEENESKNANMIESYPLNKTHEKWTGDNDSNHEKIKIFHNWLKNIFRKFKPNSQI